MKTPENQGFSGVFRGYKMEALKRNGLTSSQAKKIFVRVLPTYQQNYKYIAITEKHLLYHSKFSVATINIINIITILL